MKENTAIKPTKITEELLHQLTSCSTIESYLAENTGEFIPSEFSTYLETLLVEKQLTRSDVIRDSCMNRAYVHQIFSGIKRPSRDKLVAISFGLHLTLDEVQTLLKYGGEANLYPRNKRDSILIYCVNKQLGIMDTEAILYNLSETPLLNY